MLLCNRLPTGALWGRVVVWVATGQPLEKAPASAARAVAVEGAAESLISKEAMAEPGGRYSYLEGLSVQART